MRFLKGYIGIAGTIGVGKSTLTEKLARARGYEPALEDAAANPYLPLFYEDMRTNVTKMQIWFLNYRVREHRALVKRIRSGEVSGVIKDRTVWEDTVFAKMFNRRPEKILSDLDYRTYLELFENMVLYDPVFPKIMIYLDCRPETALERIKERGRPMEQGMKLDYLKALQDTYYEFLEEMEEAGVGVIRLDWENFVPTDEVVRRIGEVEDEKILIPA